jgi:hypothetical protein
LSRSRDHCGQRGNWRAAISGAQEMNSHGIGRRADDP